MTVDSGTRVRVNLKYTVKPGVLTPTNNTLTYQLPKGLPMPDVVTGNIVDESDKDKAGNAKVVGSFTVDTDGTVTLRLQKYDKSRKFRTPGRNMPRPGAPSKARGAVFRAPHMPSGSGIRARTRRG